MKNILISFIKNQKKCTHKNALLYTNEGYCPDCGEYLIKNYYIVRCARCEIKREAKIVWDEIMPASKFCSNCGESEYIIEKLDKINFVDAQYAIYTKEIIDKFSTLHPDTQIWVEKEGNTIKRLTVN